MTPRAFSRINTTWSCANDAGLNQWLKGDLGFDGFVVSDWGAQHGTADFALGGLDMEQEWVQDAEYYGDTLTAYVANGTIPMARLDDMARRVLLPMYALNYSTPSSAPLAPMPLPTPLPTRPWRRSSLPPRQCCW